MNFVVDESSGKSVVEELRRLGHDVISIQEIFPKASSFGKSHSDVIPKGSCLISSTVLEMSKMLPSMTCCDAL